MTRLAIDAAQAAGEIADFSRRMAAGARALAALAAPVEGCSARDPVHQQDRVILYRYRALAPSAGLPPLLICYALVNRPYMMDLQPDRSLIRGLLLRGLDVYLIDWGYPGPADRFLDLDDYINRYLGGCMDHVRRTAGVPALNLLGVCQGGTFALCHAAMQPEAVRNLVVMVTPVDFHTAENLLSKWIRGVDVERMVEVLGNVPGEILNATFLALMPLRLTVQKYAGIADIADDPAALANFLRMEKWILDSPDQAGTAFAQFVRWFFQQNRLVRGGLEIGGRHVDLARIGCPVLNIRASQDHLVPPSATLPLRDLVGSRDYTDFEFDGGHIGIYVSARAQQLLPQAIAGWLERR